MLTKMSSHFDLKLMLIWLRNISYFGVFHFWTKLVSPNYLQSLSNWFYILSIWPVSFRIDHVFAVIWTLIQFLPCVDYGTVVERYWYQIYIQRRLNKLFILSLCRLNVYFEVIWTKFQSNLTSRHLFAYYSQWLVWWNVFGVKIRINTRHTHERTTYARMCHMLTYARTHIHKNVHTHAHTHKRATYMYEHTTYMYIHHSRTHERTTYIHMPTNARHTHECTTCAHIHECTYPWILIRINIQHICMNARHTYIKHTHERVHSQ